jgi:hypothetical protein
MCHVRGWNLSYESLTLFDAQKKLRDLKVEDPVFWNELSGEGVASDLPAPDETVPEDAIDEGDDDEYGDDSSIGLATVVKAVVNEGATALKAVVGIWEDGGLAREAFAEDDNEEPVDLIDGMVDDGHVPTGVVDDSDGMGTRTNAAGENLPQNEGRGRRKKISNKQFANFIRHDDNEDSDFEL